MTAQPVSVTRGRPTIEQTALRAIARAKRRRDAFVAASVADPWLMRERTGTLARLYVQADGLAGRLRRLVMPNLDADQTDADWLKGSVTL